MWIGAKRERNGFGGMKGNVVVSVELKDMLSNYLLHPDRDLSLTSQHARTTLMSLDNSWFVRGGEVIMKPHALSHDGMRIKIG